MPAVRSGGGRCHAACRSCKIEETWGSDSRCGRGERRGVSRRLLTGVSCGLLTSGQWLRASVGVEVAGHGRQWHRPSSGTGDGRGGVSDGHGGIQSSGRTVAAGDGQRQQVGDAGWAAATAGQAVGRRSVGGAGRATAAANQAGRRWHCAGGRQQRSVGELRRESTKIVSTGRVQAVVRTFSY
jgi:hypothetical protein